MAVQYAYRQLYVEALAYVGIKLDDISSDPEMLVKAKSWPNRAVDDLVRYHAWPWLTTTADLLLAANATSVSLPSDFEALAADDFPTLVGIANSGLSPVSGSEIRRAITTVQSGQPYQYRLGYNGSVPVLLFDVSAGNQYVVRVPYLRSIQPMVVDTAYPALPLSMHDIVRLGTMAIAEEEQDRVPQGRMRPMYETAKAQARLRVLVNNPNDIRPTVRWSGETIFDSSSIRTSKVVIGDY